MRTGVNPLHKSVFHKQRKTAPSVTGRLSIRFMQYLYIVIESKTRRCFTVGTCSMLPDMCNILSLVSAEKKRHIFDNMWPCCCIVGHIKLIGLGNRPPNCNVMFSSSYRNKKKKTLQLSQKTEARHVVYTFTQT